MDRRRYLARVAAVATVALAGCGESPDTPTDDPTDTAAPATTPPGTPTSSPTPTDSPTPSPTPTATATPLPPVAAEVTVGPGSAFRFEPETARIATGETVRWRWDSGGHNVKATSTPSDADWTGTPGGDSETFDAGHVYEHTFDVAGRYDYVCVPHRSLGMEGAVVVE